MVSKWNATPFAAILVLTDILPQHLTNVRLAPIMNGRAGQVSATEISTSISLLRRLKERQQDAWVRVTRIYGPLVYRWCRRSGVPTDDVADVAQEVFVAVAAGIDGFRREQARDSFRGWLWGITKHKVNDFFRHACHRPEAMGGTDAQLRMGQIPFAPDAAGDCPTSGDDATLMLHRALELIRGDFEERNWQAFFRSTVEQQSSPDIARDLKMTPNAVRQAKYRVLRRLRNELEELE